MNHIGVDPHNQIIVWRVVSKVGGTGTLRTLKTVRDRVRRPRK